MQNKPTSEKPHYHDHLRSIAKEVYKDVIRYNSDEADTAIDRIAVALIDAATESWNNGISAGRRRASKAAATPKQS